MKRIILAPMEGVVDASMRLVLSNIGGIDLCVTEFLRVTDKLNPKAFFYKYCPELRHKSQTAAGVDVYFQLLGGIPGAMAANAVFAYELGAKGIDLNFGCPAKRVNQHDGGAALLKNPSRVYDVVKAVRDAVPKDRPVTAKIRLGFADKSLALENSMAAQEAGAKWLVVHARTKVEAYKPPAHWEWIAKIREHLSIPVIANGDIWSLDDFIRCREVSGCEQFMLGRGLIARPHLALQIKAYLENKNRVVDSWSLLRKELFAFMELCKTRSDDERYVLNRTKQWMNALRRNYPEAQSSFATLKLSKDYSSLVKSLQV